MGLFFLNHTGPFPLSWSSDPRQFSRADEVNLVLDQATAIKSRALEALTANNFD
jgi:NACalpha-BTF3-like transcription factor